MIQFTPRLGFGYIIPPFPWVLTEHFLGSQGERLGTGGIDTTPSDERAAPAPPSHLQLQTEATGNPESLTKVMPQSATGTPTSVPYAKLLPRETGEDIGMGSPVPLSSEAVEVITRLRNMKVSASMPLRRSE